MSDTNMNIDNVLLVERRLTEACNGLKAGSPELKSKLHNTLNDLFDEGVLIEPVIMDNPFKINVKLAGNIKEINIKCEFN